MKLGNTSQVPYGIRNEKTDLRAHVSVVTKSVYVFEPRYAVAAMDTGKFMKLPAYTGSLTTATGFLVPPSAIKNCKRIPIPEDLMREAHFDRRDSTPVKGRKAENVVRKMIALGLISLVLDTVEVTDEGMQIDGEDFLVNTAQSIQVKCDWSAGPRELGGTGNLYLQETEANPLKLY